MYGVRISGDGVKAIRKLGVNLRQFAEEATQKLAFEVTGEMMDDAPVLTGRSRMGFAAVQRRFYTVSYSSKGTATRKGQAEGLRKSHIRVKKRATYYEITVENTVVYVPYYDAKNPYIRQALRKGIVKNRRELARTLHDLMK